MSTEYFMSDIRHAFHTAKAGTEKAQLVLTKVKTYVEWYNRWFGNKITKELVTNLEGVLYQIKKANHIAGYMSDIEKIADILDQINKASERNKNGENSQLLALLFGRLIVAVSVYVTGFPGASFYARSIREIGENFSKIYAAFDPWGSVNQFSPSDQVILRRIIANPNGG